jgi:CCR4-NOT transcription complex subunit 1
MFLAGHPNHQLVFMRIWQIEPSYLTNAFRDFYEENPLNITRILDVAQDLKVRVRNPVPLPFLTSIV